MTQTITIPNSKILNQEKELILIPRKEYETLVRIKMRRIAEIGLTTRQKQAIARSERELQKGNYFTLNEFVKHLEGSRSKAHK